MSLRENISKRPTVSSVRPMRLATCTTNQSVNSIVEAAKARHQGHQGNQVLPTIQGAKFSEYDRYLGFNAIPPLCQPTSYRYCPFPPSHVEKPKAETPLTFVRFQRDPTSPLSQSGVDRGQGHHDRVEEMPSDCVTSPVVKVHGAFGNGIFAQKINSYDTLSLPWRTAT